MLCSTCSMYMWAHFGIWKLCYCCEYLQSHAVLSKDLHCVPHNVLFLLTLHLLLGVDEKWFSHPLFCCVHLQSFAFGIIHIFCQWYIFTFNIAFQPKSICIHMILVAITCTVAFAPKATTMKTVFREFSSSTSALL